MIVPIVLLVNLLCFATAAPISHKIVYGYEAYPGQFPYMAQLKNYGSFVCSSSIISSNFILTAAHCFDDRTFDGWSATVGSIDIYHGGDTYDVSYVYNHPQYDRKTFVHDISLLQLSKHIQFNNHVQIIYLNPYDPRDFYSATNSGWGASEWQGGPSRFLKYVEQTIVSEQECSQQMGRATPFEVCARAPQGDGSCSGDSGGPIVSNGWQLGVVSLVTIPCGNGPSVFARVDAHLDWIRQYVNV